MKVSELPYIRVTLEDAASIMQGIISRIKNAENVDEILRAREDYLKFNTEYCTANALSYMRYSVNTADEFYVAEKAYYDEIGPPGGKLYRRIFLRSAGFTFPQRA